MQPCPQGAYNLTASQKSNKVKKKLNSSSQVGTPVSPQVSPQETLTKEANVIF